MTASLPVPALALAALFAAAGIAAGWAYFAALRRTVELYAAGSGRLVPAALSLGRIGGAIVFFGASARFGAVALLAAFLGFLVARAAALRAARKDA